MRSWLAVCCALCLLAASVGAQGLFAKLKAHAEAKRLERQQRKAERLAAKRQSKEEYVNGTASGDDASTFDEPYTYADGGQPVAAFTTEKPARQRCYGSPSFCRGKQVKCARACAKHAKRQPGVIGTCEADERERTRCCCKLP